VAKLIVTPTSDCFRLLDNKWLLAYSYHICYPTVLVTLLLSKVSSQWYLHPER